MKTSILCPISEKKVNENATRINALIGLTLLSLFAFTHNIFIVVFLALDFFLRAADFSKFSVIAITSRQTVRLFELQGPTINAGPKLFAARIGLLFCLLVLVSQVLDFTVLADLLAGTLGLFSFLEAAFGFCLACEIYPFVYKFTAKN
jgi:hypothetical protein